MSPGKTPDLGLWPAHLMRVLAHATLASTRQLTSGMTGLPIFSWNPSTLRPAVLLEEAHLSIQPEGPAGCSQGLAFLRQENCPFRVSASN